jgi:hypothetical protein
MNMLDYNASMKFARKEGFARGEALGLRCSLPPQEN